MTFGEKKMMRCECEGVVFFLVLRDIVYGSEGSGEMVPLFGGAIVSEIVRAKMTITGVVNENFGENDWIKFESERKQRPQTETEETAKVSLTDLDGSTTDTNR